MNIFFVDLECHYEIHARHSESSGPQKTKQSKDFALLEERHKVRFYASLTNNNNNNNKNKNKNKNNNKNIIAIQFILKLTVFD
jgi:hypothetical protein